MFTSYVQLRSLLAEILSEDVKDGQQNFEGRMRLQTVVVHRRTMQRTQNKAKS